MRPENYDSVDDLEEDLADEFDVDTISDGEDIAPLSKGFEPMNIQSGETPSGPNRCVKICKTGTTFCTIVAIVVVAFLAISHALEGNISPPKPPPMFNSSASTRTLKCVEASSVRGGTVGGHCETIFVNFIYFNFLT